MNIYGDGDAFFIQYLCHLFARHDVGRALRNVCCDITNSLVNSDDMDIFLNQLIQFYSNNATSLDLTPHTTPCCPTT